MTFDDLRKFTIPDRFGKEPTDWWAAFLEDSPQRIILCPDRGRLEEHCSRTFPGIIPDIGRLHSVLRNHDEAEFEEDGVLSIV